MRKGEAEINKNSEERIKIVEEGSRKVRDMLAPKNSDKRSVCSQKKCPLCKSSKFVEMNPKATSTHVTQTMLGTGGTAWSATKKMKVKSINGSQANLPELVVRKIKT